MTAARFSPLHLASLTCIPIAGALLNGFYNGPLYRVTPLLFWAADIVLYVVAPIAIVYWLAKFAKVFPINYGLKFPPYGGFESVASSIFLAFVLFVTNEAAKQVGWVFTWRWYVEPDFSYGAVAPDGFLRPLVALYWSLSAGLVESVFYIGLPWYLW